ncbi:hypothetical protein Golob_022785 [Gossypium lobatum]|uniref:Uncharacterized protein n=1 Tax=Gossypium lobatum TaxID=34289 RepID=A0A7J8LHK7_9ROSI|nr:hypothetical protein [Gossypium lobatum]
MGRKYTNNSKTVRGYSK